MVEAMIEKSTPPKTIVIIGAGPAGLMAAETLARAEQVFENNTIDFSPIAKELLEELVNDLEPPAFHVAPWLKSLPTPT